MADLLGKLLFVQPQVGGVVFDLNLGEQHNFGNEVTSHRVEEGADITDHIQNQLRQGQLTGLITNYSVSTMVPPFIKNRVKDTYDLLKFIWEKELPLDIVTFFETYKNVALVNIGVGSPDSGTAANFQVTFREIRTVKLQEVKITANVNPGELDNDTSRQASPGADRGRQVGVPQ